MLSWFFGDSAWSGDVDSGYDLDGLNWHSCLHHVVHLFRCSVMFVRVIR